jgi:HSP20 family protein
MTIHTIPLTTTTLPTLSLRRELDRLFDDVFVNRPAAAWTPAADAREDSTGFTITLDVPGLAPESVEVLAEDGTLTVKGARPAATLAEGERTLFAERSQGAFQRRFRLPKSADPQAIEATYAHGVLSLRIGKLAPAQPRRVPVTVAGVVQG